MVARERLLDRLREASGLRVTVVAALAGYGKTTLLGTGPRPNQSGSLARPRASRPMTITNPSRPGAQSLIVRFNAAARGAALEV